MSNLRIGDWVVNTTLSKPKPFVWTEEFYNDESIHNNGSHIQLWRPEVGEFVMLYNFADELQKSFRVAQFKQMAHGQYKDMQGNYFTYCEPFTGKLPFWIKE